MTAAQVTGNVTVLVTGDLLGESPPQPVSHPVRGCGECGELVTVPRDVLASAQRHGVDGMLLILCPPCRARRGPVAGSQAGGGMEGPPVAVAGAGPGGGEPGGGCWPSAGASGGHGEPAARPHFNPAYLDRP